MNFDNLNTYWVMIGFSVIIILSYLFNFISRKTRIPSVILLIATGVILNIAFSGDDINLKPFLEILGIVGLIMIVLEASLDLEIEREKAGIMVRAILAAIISLALNAISIGYIILAIFNVPWTQALIYAVPLSIMSSAIIIPSVAHLEEHRREFLIYEASFSDIFGIMVFYFLLDSLRKESATEMTFHILGNVGLTLIISVVLGYLIMFMIQKVKAQVKLFLPIAVLILLYSIGKLFHLSSLVFILVFGLMINNRHLFFRGALKRLFTMDSFEESLEDIKVLTLETSFIIRTFFFIVFGMTITIEGLNDPLVYLIGILALLVMIGSRYGLLSMLVRKTMQPALYVAPRGLITILLFFAIPEDVIIPGFKSATLLLIILGSNLLMTYGLMKYKPKEEDDEESENAGEGESATTDEPEETGDQYRSGPPEEGMTPGDEKQE